MSQAESDALFLVKHHFPSRYVLFPNSQTLSVQVWASLTLLRQMHVLSIEGKWGKKKVNGWNLETYSFSC